MVDAVISLAVEKLGDALIRETFYILDVRGQIEGLRDEFRRMQCFVKDADAKEQQGDERVRNWVEDIRNLAYDAEDVIDTFMLKVDATRKTKSNGIRNFVSRKAMMVKNLGHLRRVGIEILAIQNRLKAISESRITYCIQDLGSKGASSSEANQRRIQHPLRNRYPHVEDNDVIGFEEHTKTLLTELLKDEKECCVVSIIGVGGLGKTTLAKKIYNHDSVKIHFECCGWSSISQQLDLKDTLGEILKKCMTLSNDEVEKNKLLNERDLVEKIYIYLKDKLYLIVLDDVWKLDQWSSLSPAFPTGKRGSKVLLTTRNKKVALHADPFGLHFEPQLLNQEESWALFCRKAFPRDMVKDGRYPVGLEKLGREMVLKCRGLPLGICVLGGLLATKRSEIKQWELVHRDVVSCINEGENGGVNGILALSYHDLPSHLKPCFLYFGVFPEDYAIPRKKLIQLWVAEGFIPHTREKSLISMEDIGKHQYLAELSQRCMIQIRKEFKKKSVCQVHDLMRDLCLSKAKEINFLNIYNLQHTGNITTDACKRVRRYAAHLDNAEKSKRYEAYFSRSEYTVRTLIFGTRSDILLEPINYRNIKLLRVLDLRNVKCQQTNITKEVSKLIHLRYLYLVWCSAVSSSIGNLGNLQTLGLMNYGGNLPETTSGLVQLRHLELSSGSVDPNFQIENLINLQTIDRIIAGKWIKKGCFKKLSNLRRLYVYDTSRFQTNIILDEVARKQSLLPSWPSSSTSSSDDQYQNSIRSLRIETKEGFPSSTFDSLSSCSNLRKLYLDGSLHIVALQKYPPNLTKLYLYDVVFTKDPMATLQHLPKLRMLILILREYEGEEMICCSKGFPQLQYLNMYWFVNVEEWRVDLGGMPLLKELCLSYFDKLKMLPEGLKSITTLEKLNIINARLIRERVVKGVGADWYKIQHIASIDSSFA